MRNTVSLRVIVTSNVFKKQISASFTATSIGSQTDLSVELVMTRGLLSRSVVHGERANDALDEVAAGGWFLGGLSGLRRGLPRIARWGKGAAGCLLWLARKRGGKSA